MIEEKIVRCPACDGEGSFRRLEEIDEKTGILKKSELCGFCDGNKRVRLVFSQKLRQKANGGAGGCGSGGNPIASGNNGTFTPQEDYITYKAPPKPRLKLTLDDEELDLDHINLDGLQALGKGIYGYKISIIISAKIGSEIQKNLKDFFKSRY